MTLLMLKSFGVETVNPGQLFGNEDGAINPADLKFEAVQDRAMKPIRARQGPGLHERDDAKALNSQSKQRVMLRGDNWSRFALDLNNTLVKSYFTSHVQGSPAARS